MVTTTATIKGQVLIPIALRRKYHIRKGTRLMVIDKDGEIVLKPLIKDPIAYGYGFLKGSSALKALTEDRKKEALR